MNLRLLYEREKTLLLFSVLCLLGMIGCIFGLTVDSRFLMGAPVWLKPLKFFISAGMFSLSAAWIMSIQSVNIKWLYPLFRHTLVFTLSFELIYITWRAALGQKSHFNYENLFAIIMYSIMGFAIVAGIFVFLGLAIVLIKAGWLKSNDRVKEAVVFGLIITFVLGGGFGGYMSSQLGHLVGTNITDDTNGLPLLKWSTEFGDLRIAHFFGLHALQLLPILAWLLRGRFAMRSRFALIGWVILYCLFTIALFVQAIYGEPIIGSLR